MPHPSLPTLEEIAESRRWYREAFTRLVNDLGFRTAEEWMERELAARHDRIGSEDETILIAVESELLPLGSRWSGLLAIDPATGRAEASFHAIDGVLPLGHGDATLRAGHGEMSASRVADILALLRERAFSRFQTVRGELYDEGTTSMLVCRLADGQIQKFNAGDCNDGTEPALRLARALWQAFAESDLIETKRVPTVAWQDRACSRSDEPQAR